MLQPIGSSTTQLALDLQALLRTIQPALPVAQVAPVAAAALTGAGVAGIPETAFQSVMDLAQAAPPQAAGAASVEASVVTSASTAAMADTAKVAAAVTAALPQVDALEAVSPVPDPALLAAEQAALVTAQAADTLAQVIQTVADEDQRQADAVLAAQVAALTAAGSGLDPSQLFSGLPLGSAATLMGGGWASPLTASNAPMTEFLTTFFFAVNAVQRIAAASTGAGDVTQHPGDGAAAQEAYGYRHPSREAMREAVGPAFEPQPASVDILD